MSEHGDCPKCPATAEVPHHWLLVLVFVLGFAFGSCCGRTVNVNVDQQRAESGK